MIKYIGTKDFKIEEKTAVAIGKFDGIHRGHRRLFGEICKYKKQGLKTAIFTFDMSKASFFRGDDAKVLTTNQEKEEYLADLGIDFLVEYPVTHETTAMEARAFIKEILVGKMNAAYIIAGPDCSYGYMGKGNIELLKQCESEYGFSTIVVEKELEDGLVISSTYVRKMVEEGNVEQAQILLGRPYSISGKVCHGRKLGRTLDMPTVNLLPEEGKLLPPFGVYMSEVIVGTKHYNGITNIGMKPTVSQENQVGVETYLYDFCDDLYGEKIQVDLLHYSRKEQKFDSVDALKAKLKQDMSDGEEFHRKRTCNL